MWFTHFESTRPTGAHQMSERAKPFIGVIEGSFTIGGWPGLGLAALRIMSGMLFAEHGTQKLIGFPEPAHGISPVLSLMGLAGCLEVFGGFLLVLGIQLALRHSSSPAKWRLRILWRMLPAISFRCSMKVMLRSFSVLSFCFLRWSDPVHSSSGARQPGLIDSSASDDCTTM